MVFLITEIARIRSNLFHMSGTKNEPLDLPEASGTVLTLSEKVYVPVKEHPDVSFSHTICITCMFGIADWWELSFFCVQFNFVGRILGPRGMTAKQLEQETGCKIMVRGKGSMRDKKKVTKQNVVTFSKFLHFIICLLKSIAHFRIY